VFDLFADEPAPSKSPLVDAPNCLMTSRVAGLTDLSVHDLCRAVSERVVSALDGVIDRSWMASPEMLESWHGPVGGGVA
jgi:phosphoglycerate dehydrogenase-like enzyme